VIHMKYIASPSPAHGAERIDTVVITLNGVITARRFATTQRLLRQEVPGHSINGHPLFIIRSRMTDTFAIVIDGGARRAARSPSRP